MDLLQDQVAELTTKIDALHQMIEQLNGKISEALSNGKPSAGSTNNHVPSSIGLGYSFHQHRDLADGMMEHKDVLVDNNRFDMENQSGERVLSPEIQIQRLTAQLTAAYNRIAALEEQLLSHRIH
ncbi:MAG: hypothetical protein HC881_16685 [Leptolyngbyaceae cyanobacterium SL_7_1]|nr:hypothetical protein [Leptolyngbyaceae cyanobacterium SL_7_1]